MKQPSHLQPAYGNQSDSDDLDGYSMPTSGNQPGSESNKNKVVSSQNPSVVAGSAAAALNSGVARKPGAGPLVPTLDELEDLDF